MKNYHNPQNRRLFVFFDDGCPKDRMMGAVMHKISERRLSRVRAAATIHGILILGAVSAFVPALEHAISRASASGFFEYISLAFSDSGLIASYWKDFVFSMAESVPAIETACVVAALLVFVYFSKKISEDISFLRLHLA